MDRRDVPAGGAVLAACAGAEPLEAHPFALTVTAIALPLERFATTGSLGAALAALIISPLWAILWVYVVSGLTHAGLIVVRGRVDRFDETLACVCYSSAPILFGIIPLVGAWVGSARLFIDVNGSPTLAGSNADLAPHVDACLRHRPSSETTPPRGSAPQ